MSLSYGTIALLLQLSKLRSDYLVGAGLAQAFPSEESWAEFTGDPTTLEELTEFGMLVDELRHQFDGTTPTPEAVASAAANVDPRRLGVVALTAERLGVDPGDLVAALLTVG